MTKVLVKHPTFKDVEMEVEEKDLDDYLDAGWLEQGQRRKAAAKTAPVSDAETSPATVEN